jgi:DNA-binding NarL/FixJ family response regulator
VKPYLSGVLVGETKKSTYSDPVAIVSDRQLSVAAMAALLLRGGEGVVVQRARGAQEVAEMIRSSRVDVVIAEGTWHELPAEMKSITPAVLLVVDPDADAATLGRLFKSEAAGFVSHTASSDSLRVALDAVRTLGHYFDPCLEGCLSEATRQAAERAAASQLSERERLILTEIANGKSSKEIATEFSVTVKTVCNHVSNVYRKLHLTHRGELVKYAFDQGLARL